MDWRPYTPTRGTESSWYTQMTLVCPKCGRQFERLEELFEHLRLHAGSSKRVVVKVEVS